MSPPGERSDGGQADATAEATGDGSDAGRRLFAGPCSFVRGVVRLDDLPPPDLPEVAFVGRSNCGKSSLLNAVTGRRALARTSNTPGRTQQLNFFNLADRLMLVDLPGYGFARASKADIAAWTRAMRAYLRGRVPLRRVCLLIDSRHGIKPNDTEMMKLLDDAAVSYQVVLTKIDKLSAGALAERLDAVQGTLKQHPAALPAALATSARDGTGIAELRNEIATLAANDGDALRSPRHDADRET